MIMWLDSHDCAWSHLAHIASLSESFTRYMHLDIYMVLYFIYIFTYIYINSSVL